jgi:hypothetical protein
MTSPGGGGGVSDLHLKLEGPARLISALALGEGLVELHRLLNRIQSADGEVREVSWRISGLSVSSADCALAPPPDALDEGNYRISVMWAGAEQLSRQPGVPERWTENAVESLIRLSSITKRDGVDSAVLSRDGGDLVRLDEQIKANAQKSISRQHESIGSVVGTVYRWIDADRREIGVQEASTGRKVVVTFGAELRDEVSRVVGANVQIRAWGRLKRDADNHKVSLFATGLEVVEPVDLPRSADAIVGALGAEWTDGLGSVDWVRSQRG